jgi:hypothetical protein
MFVKKFILHHLGEGDSAGLGGLLYWDANEMGSMGLGSSSDFREGGDAFLSGCVVRVPGGDVSRDDVPRLGHRPRSG